MDTLEITQDEIQSLETVISFLELSPPPDEFQSLTEDLRSLRNKISTGDPSQ